MAQKPIDQLHKNSLESSKTPIIFKMPKLAMRMHEKCMKTRKKLEKEGQKGLNLAKILKENDKNWWWSQEPTRRERGTWKSLNSDFEKVLFCLFKKPDTRVSIGRKLASTGRNKQRLPLSKNFKILKISIGRKTEWTDRIRQRLTIFFRKNTIFEKQVDLTQIIEN